MDGDMAPVLVLDFEPVTIYVRDGEKGSQIIDVVSSVRGSSDASHVMLGVAAHLAWDVIYLFGYDGERKS
jgi:hypothetical protein